MLPDLAGIKPTDTWGQWSFLAVRRVFPQKFIKGDRFLLTHILGSYGIISGVNCLNFIENIANFKRHQCVSKDEGFKKSCF